MVKNYLLDVRKFMGVKKENWTFEEIIRDAYIRGKIFNIGEEVLQWIVPKVECS